MCAVTNSNKMFALNSYYLIRGQKNQDLQSGLQLQNFSQKFCVITQPQL